MLLANSSLYIAAGEFGFGICESLHAFKLPVLSFILPGILNDWCNWPVWMLLWFYGWKYNSKWGLDKYLVV